MYITILGGASELASVFYFVYHTFYSPTGPDGEPKITHGNTLVSDLSLKEVTKVIDVSTINTGIFYSFISIGICIPCIQLSSNTFTRESLF